MENGFQFQSIDGEFTPAGAAKVLFPLINNKINYHSLESFSNEIRFEKDATNSKKRISEFARSTVANSRIIRECRRKRF